MSGFIGNPQEWDSSIDYTAGVVDIDECEDQLTGWATLNNTGFAFRNNGISILSPTGIGAAPFFIENFSEGPTGIGVSFPYTLAQYGQICAFVALDDIYAFTGASPQAIGGNAKKSIMKDVFNASSFTVAEMFGSLGQGIDYLSYWLALPQSNDTYTSLWIYHFDSQSWVNIQLPYKAVRSMSNLALT